MPGLDKERARRIKPTDYGLELGGASARRYARVLGGMAMPEIGVSAEEMADFLGVPHGVDRCLA